MTRQKKERITYLFLTLGFIVQVITDTLYAVLLISDYYTYGSFIDPLWTLAILLIGYSGLYVEEEKEETVWKFLSKPYAAVDNGLFLNGSVIVLTALVLESNDWEWDSLTFGLVVSIIFIVIRQFIVIKENRQLLVELWHSAYHDKLTGLTNRTSFLRDMMYLEITESVVKNIADSTRILNELDLMGVRTSMDDFGTGYSSLSVLKDLQIEAIKIDRSFIQELTDADIAMMKSIMTIGFNLNLEVVVEGIEHEQQVEALLAISNRTIFGQGYLFSKPAPAEEIEKLF